MLDTPDRSSMHQARVTFQPGFSCFFENSGADGDYGGQRECLHTTLLALRTGHRLRSSQILLTLKRLSPPVIALAGAGIMSNC